jgi:hypothetical protein
MYTVLNSKLYQMFQLSLQDCSMSDIGLKIVQEFVQSNGVLYLIPVDDMYLCDLLSEGQYILQARCDNLSSEKCMQRLINDMENMERFLEISVQDIQCVK